MGGTHCLLRLHRVGLIELPAPRNGNGRGLSRQRVAWPTETPVECVVDDLCGLHLAPVAERAASALWTGVIERYLTTFSESLANTLRTPRSCFFSSPTVMCLRGSSTIR